MKITADLHIHSHFSRATSKDLDFPHLALWAQRKGIHIVGTGDISHPGWLAEMHATLDPAEEGLFRLKPDIAQAVDAQLPDACRGTVRFLLAGEISNIYKRGSRTRKVHNVVFAPDLDAVARLQTKLETIGNIRSDGRPILGLDSRDLLEIMLEIDERCALIPAHIWTPWFSMLGSKSGFDSVEACFADLTPHIFALETGLSSDPPMNWRVSDLDPYTLVSHSDAHSPPKLAREATLFDIDLSYPALFAALKSGDPAQFKGTLEFFPEEGKYHLDGHRKCNVCWEPTTTRSHAGLCTVCGKPVTVGVSHRVEELADRPPNSRPARTHPFQSLIPLPEILSEIAGVGPKSKTVQREYMRLLADLGPELTILRTLPLDTIARSGGQRLAQGIDRMRRGHVLAQGGYDGEFGTIKVFPGMDATIPVAQFGFFEKTETESAKVAAGGIDFPSPSLVSPSVPEMVAATPNPKSLNPDQQAAITVVDAPLVITAGPGTGKTRTLTMRMAHLLTQGVAPETILAITFTNRAAAEMAERLTDLVGAPTAARLTIATFHAFGVRLLRQHGHHLDLDPNFVILAEDERHALLARLLPEASARRVDEILAHISTAKNQLTQPDDPEIAEIAARYEATVTAAHALDFDDLIRLPVQLLEERPEAALAIRKRYRWISVDEYQDVNLAQYRFLKLLAEPVDGQAANLCVIGDPDQAIYGFRGADHRYFRQFEQDYPGAVRLTLSRNYRSAPAILDAAAQVIAGNPDRDAVDIWTDLVSQVKLDVIHTPTDKAEAETVVHRMEQMVGGTSYFSLDSGRVDDRVGAGDEAISHTFGDFAVLYRLNAQARLLAVALDRSGIPYQTAGETPLTARKPIRVLLAYLWLRANPKNRVHLALILGEGKGSLNGADLEKLWPYLETADPLADGLRAAHDSGDFPRPQRERLLSLAVFWREMADASGVAILVGKAHAYHLTLGGDAPAADDVARLTQRAALFGDRLTIFLESVALQSETDAYDPRADRVALMSIHAAKGLEFPVVFVVGCEDGLLPYRPANRDVDLAEERRLFYVAMTRAKRRLILTHARSRFLFGQSVENPRSPYVDDIEAALLALQTSKRMDRPPAQPTGTQLSLF